MSEWKDISTAPKDGTIILLAHHAAAWDGYWEEKEAAWVDGETNLYNDLLHYEPTHWQPLPPLPPHQKDNTNDQ